MKTLIEILRWRGGLSVKRSAISLALALGVAVSAAGQTTIDTSIIRVVYPKFEQSIAAVDSTFIIGSVPPGWTLTANDQPVEVHAGGGWLAYLPLTPGEFSFNLRASRGAETVALDWPVFVPELPLPDSFTAPQVYGNYRNPNTPRSFHIGDIVDLQMRGTPGCRAWAEIPGFADSIPLSESQGVSAPFYGASVWEDSDNHTPRILGVYQGIYQLNSDSAADSLAVIYHIARPSFADALRYLRERAPAEIQFEALRALKWNDDRTQASDTGEPLLSFNPLEFPRTVEFTDTVQIVRVGPRRGYLGLFQPAGVRALADGFDGEWYTIRLTDTRTGYVHRESVKLLADGIQPPRSRLSSFRSSYADNQLEIRAALSGRHPFSISEPDRRTLVLELFGVTMDTDWFRYDFKDPHIENASWTQPEPGLFRLELRFNTPLWGYRAKYKGSVFHLTVRYPPENVRSLRGKRIVVDPGHSRDPGSIGPTGYTEAEANLGIALKLRDELTRRGALVTLTRSDSSHVELYDRPKIADSANADLFVSVHNNALPDGANPFVNWGVSTYHYHTHSIELARAVHAEMLKLPNQRDHGFYHGNLAVCRPTERPSILVECGFMILPEQEAWLKTDFYRARVAKAIAQGVENFFKDFGREKQ